jgi:hypothetical protein
MVMSEQLNSHLEERSRALFNGSVESMDFALRSRLTQARAAALEAAAQPLPWLFRATTWAPAAGVTAAAVLGVAFWFGSPTGHPGAALSDNQSNFEDMELVASTDDNSADAMEMLQDDIDFYDFADKAAG